MELRSSLNISSITDLSVKNPQTSTYSLTGNSKEKLIALKDVLENNGSTGHKEIVHVVKCPIRNMQKFKNKTHSSPSKRVGNKVEEKLFVPVKLKHKPN